MLETLIAAFLTWAQVTTLMPVAGLATFYGPPAFMPGDLMRNGELLNPTAPTVAVDDSLWPAWANAELLVFVPGCGRFLKVRVTDTGRLMQAGTFRLGVRNGILRYWPFEWEDLPLELAIQVIEEPVVEEGTVWLDDRALFVIADFPSEFYRNEVACQPNAPGGAETEEVWLWIIQPHSGRIQ